MRGAGGGPHPQKIDPEEQDQQDEESTRLIGVRGSSPVVGAGFQISACEKERPPPPLKGIGCAPLVRGVHTLSREIPRLKVVPKFRQQPRPVGQSKRHGQMFLRKLQHQDRLHGKKDPTTGLSIRSSAEPFLTRLARGTADPMADDETRSHWDIGTPHFGRPPVTGA